MAVVVRRRILTVIKLRFSKVAILESCTHIYICRCVERARDFQKPVPYYIALQLLYKIS
jgi:hypothetical protein